MHNAFIAPDVAQYIKVRDRFMAIHPIVVETRL